MKLKCLLLAVISSISLPAASLTVLWNQNTELDIAKYNVYESVNGALPVITPVNFPTTRLTYSNILAGASYTFFVTAVNTAFLESDPSLSVSYSAPLIPPQINVLSVVPTSKSGTNWLNVAVAFTPVDLALYRLGNVTLTASPPSGSNLVFSALATPFIVPSLPINSYTWSASASNSSGSSPTGLTKFISGTPPASVANVVIQFGP